MTLASIPEEQLSQHIRNEHSWWDTAGSRIRRIDGLTPRPYLEIFYPLVYQRDVHRAIVLMGPRRVGKTVLLYHSIERLIKNGIQPRRIGYLAVDSPLLNGLRLDELYDLYANASGVDLENEESYLFLDEIQYLPDWERHLKVAVDRLPNVRFVVSGSAAAALKRGSSESGAGRFTDFLLPPLTFHEYLILQSSKGQTDPLCEWDDDGIQVKKEDIGSINGRFIDYINFGGYPEVALSPEIQKDPGRFIKNDIIEKVLLRDLPTLYGISDVQELNTLFTTLAYNTGNEVSLSDLSNRSDLSSPTITKYLTYLEAAFLIKRIERIDNSAKRFKRAHTFKVYLTNPAMYAALFSPVKEGDQVMGRLVETALMSQLFHADKQSPPYYARWKHGEVDIVWLNENQQPSRAIEVKWSDRHADRLTLLDGLFSFANKNGLTEVIATTRSKFADITVGDIKLQLLPSAIYCLFSGYSLVKNKQSMSELHQLTMMFGGADAPQGNKGSG